MIRRKDETFAQIQGAVEVETSDDAIKLYTKLHSDVTFLSWPQLGSDRGGTVAVHNERKKASKKVPPQNQKITCSTYRHMMIADNRSFMPFAEIVNAELEVSPLPGVDE